MRKKSILFLSLSLAFLNAVGQDDASYIKENAVRIDNPEKLSDSVYSLLSPFRMIMFGEMHGTNESAPFVSGLANLFSNIGDSVQVGLEIPPDQMTTFISLHSDSSVYASEFFHKPGHASGRESFAWAKLISNLNDNPKVKVFFFDVNRGEGKPGQRDSLMYMKIKTQLKKHPYWKMVTLSGNFHNRVSEEKTMAAFLKKDYELNLYDSICTLNLEYAEGTCLADFGHGLEVKQLGHPSRVYDQALDSEKYLLLVSAFSSYQYTGFYYTKFITAAKMVNHE